MELSQERVLISSDPNTKGFDLSAGTEWIYPLNYQFREYQYNITKNSLFSNTLVCLPTGLGKTLIAAVVMYNFWRWYPRGKIVFLAPTKPLVAQQIYACHDIMGIPSTDTIELTGSMNPKNREIAWFTKRVIFATPQVFQNDLEKKIASGELVRCVVIDEAHKALGKHSYCESIRLLRTQNSCFRVLALSATPGSRIEDVCQVMKNLLISNLELRDETSQDIIPYLNKRQMDIILVPLDNDLARFKEKYISIMDRYVRLLVQYNVLRGDASTISKGRIFYLYKEFRAKTNKPGNYGQIMKTIGRCMSLYHAYDLMIRHGLRAFASFCETHAADIWMTDEPALQDLLEEIKSFLGPFPIVRPLPDGSVEEIPKDLVFGHTKLHKLKSLLSEHFEKFAAKNEETRAIVFVEYRDSVNEVYISLLQLRPTLRPKMFVGQAGQKRKQQMQAMEAFRNNEANVLISTSVGEEGLDVGEVDLIVCFDISQSSPIRLVQRMGRTGRRRDGRIVMLVTDGKEHQALKSTIVKKDSLNKKVLHSSEVVSALYQESPRMVPPDLNPECSKIHIILHPKTPAAKGKRKRKQKEDEPPKESKRRATTAKTTTALPSEVEKGGKSMQSSMLQFLRKPSTSKELDEVLSHVSQPSQGKQQTFTQIAQPECVKLFTSDLATNEFLTLCAIKASKLDSERDKLNRMDETYLRISAHDDMNDPFDYPVPDLNILDCIAFLEERMECPSPGFVDDYEFDQNYNDLYVPEPDQPNAVRYEEATNSPAVGRFNYEDLFEDSCESAEMALLDGRQETFKSSGEATNAGEGPTHNKGDTHRAALLQDDQFEKSNIDHRLLDKVSDANGPRSEEENNFPRIGCFESILDSSSDSDIPSSQTELDSRQSTRTREPSLESYALSEKQGRVEIEKSTKKPSTSSAINTTSGNRNKLYPSITKTFESSINNLNQANSANRRISTSNLNESKINNKCVDVNKPFHCDDTKTSCLNNDSDQSIKVNMDKESSSRFFRSKHDRHSDLSIGFTSKTEAYNTVVKPVNQVPNQISNGNESMKKYFEESLDEDDDIIFVGEITGVTRDNESRKIEVDDVEVVFEEGTSLMERKRANESNVNSSGCTITQILELIENSSPRRINLGKISKASQSLSNPKKSTQSQKAFRLPDKTARKEEIKSPDACTSYYFNKENHIRKSTDVTLKTDELSAELDLSDIKWEDEFEDDEEYVDCDKGSVHINKQSNSDSRQFGNDNCRTNLLPKKEDSLKTNSEDSEILLRNEIKDEKSISHASKNSLLNKKQESFKTNSDSSEILPENRIRMEKSRTEGHNKVSLLNKKQESFRTDSDDSDDSEIPLQNNMQTEKSSVEKIIDFDLGDYEWDSDFETPANPVASLKQFTNQNNTSSPNKARDANGSELASKKLFPKASQSTPLSSFAASAKKKLTTKKNEIPKPSTSRDYFDDNDSDLEDNVFYKLGGRPGKDNYPNTNYILTTNKNPMISKELNLLKNEKENAEPNSGLINLSSFSANRKDRDVRKVPFSKRATISDRKKVLSLDSYKRKKSPSRNRIGSEFLDYEAQISSDTSSGTSGEDDDLDGFVSHTQHEPVTLDMHGHYLQSIKDMHIADAFHFKKPRAFVPDNEVFSQPMSQVEESAYIHDSFCVSGGEDDLFTESQGDSLLELTERSLNGKKRKRSKNQSKSIMKKRKVAERLSDSNSSEDETEKLRKQILDESMNLKRNEN